MDYTNFLFKISEEQIEHLAKIKPEVNNVYIGLSPDIWLTTMDIESKTFNFIYLNCKNKFEGFTLQLKYKQEGFYEHILSYTVGLSRKFDIIEPVNGYNSLLYQFRTALEQIPIQTISSRELNKLEDQFYNSNGIFISPFGIEVIPFLEMKEFYQGIMSVEENRVLVEGKMYIYLILNTRNGYFKIGRSKNPLKREKTLQAEEPEIVLLRYWQAESKFERYLQKIFRMQNIRGEWFKLSISELFKFKEITDNI